MNPANLFITEAPAVQPAPPEPTLPDQPAARGGEKPFAKIMEGTIADTPPEPVRKKDPRENDGDQKKSDAALAAMINIPLSPPVVLPALPLAACDQTPVMVTAETPAIPETNIQGQNALTLAQTSQLSQGEDQRVLSGNQIQTDKPGAPDGTPIAKQGDSMKRAVKADKSSVPAEKTLPRGNFSPSAKVETGRPAKTREAAHETSEEPAELSQEIFAPREKTAEVYGKAAVEFKHFDVKLSTDEVQVDAIRVPQAEKVFDRISEQVVAFRKVGVDSMDAVLRPDRGTEISLHLSLSNNGQVDVVARVERGNFEGLQAHWSELQSSLAQQGVRVGELHQSSLNNQTSSHESSQHLGTAMGEQQQAQRQVSHSPETLDELPLVGSVTEPLKGRTSTPTTTERRGWEKWA